MIARINGNAQIILCRVRVPTTLAAQLFEDYGPKQYASKLTCSVEVCCCVGEAPVVHMAVVQNRNSLSNGSADGSGVLLQPTHDPMCLPRPRSVSGVHCTAAGLLPTPSH